MRRFAIIPLLAVASLSRAQITGVGHSGEVSRYASSQTSGYGHNGTDLNDYTDVGLNGDSGVVTSMYSNPNVHATILNYVGSGRSQNAFDPVANTYAVHLQASLSATIKLDTVGFAGIQTLAGDGLSFTLNSPYVFTIAYSSATESDINLYGPNGSDLLGISLASPGSRTLTLDAGTYLLLGEVNEYENASGYYGYTGNTYNGASSLDYRVGFAPAAVPEPATWAALGLGLLGLRRRRRA